MSLNAAALRVLADKGLSAADIADLAEAMEVRKDPTAAERQARHREKVKAERDTVTRDVTRDEVTADPSPQSPPLKSPPDPQKITPPLTPQPDGRIARATARRLPDDWKPTKLARDTVSGQIVENRGQEWAKRALESFKNHWRSANGPNARKLDWQATFANWIIEQDNRDGRSNTLGRNQSADGLSSTARAALSVFGSDPGDGRGVPQ